MTGVDTGTMAETTNVGKFRTESSKDGIKHGHPTCHDRKKLTVHCYMYISLFLDNQSRLVMKLYVEVQLVITLIVPV